MLRLRERCCSVDTILVRVLQRQRCTLVVGGECRDSELSNVIICSLRECMGKTLLTDVVFEDAGIVGEGTKTLFLVVVKIPSQRFAEKILAKLSFV